MLPDALFVRDGDIITSAGVSSGIDLALALVEDDFGPDVARKVARQMVVFLQRPGLQSQLSAPSRDHLAIDNPLRILLDRIAADPAGDYSLARMAGIANVSVRNLARLFHDEIGTTPARYVELIRIEAAQILLQEGATVATAAERSGFGSAETLRRVFVSRVGSSPSVYVERLRARDRADHDGGCRICGLPRPEQPSRPSGSPAHTRRVTHRTHHRTLRVGDHELFYREAGDSDAPVILLLHGAPASSFMFRDLIPLLADRYHVIAPDYLGFGLSDAPPVTAFSYTFDHLTDLVEGLLTRPRRAGLRDVRAGLRRPGRLAPAPPRPHAGDRRSSRRTATRTRRDSSTRSGPRCGGTASTATRTTRPCFEDH